MEGCYPTRSMRPELQTFGEFVGQEEKNENSHWSGRQH